MDCFLASFGFASWIFLVIISLAMYEKIVIMQKRNQITKQHTHKKRSSNVFG